MFRWIQRLALGIPSHFMITHVLTKWKFCVSRFNWLNFNYNSVRPQLLYRYFNQTVYLMHLSPYLPPLMEIGHNSVPGSVTCPTISISASTAIRMMLPGLDSTSVYCVKTPWSGQVPLLRRNTLF